MATTQERPRIRARQALPAPLSAPKQAAFSIVALLVVLLLIEGSVRLYHAIRSLGAAGQDEPRGYALSDPDAGYTLKPGFSSGALRIDSLGFRGPEVPTAKPIDTYRIVSLGDSVTFGPHEQECAYPFLLPGLLAPNRVESIDAGVEGYRTDRALVHLKRDVLPLRPDLIVVFIGWNDLYQTDPSRDSDELSMRANLLTRVLTWSDAAQTFRRLYFLRAGPRAPGVVSAGSAEFLASYQPRGFGERLRAIFTAARSGGADVVTLTWPTLLSDSMSSEALAKVHYPWYTNQFDELRLLYARYQQTLRQVAAQENVPVVDVAAAFDPATKAARFQDTVHFDCEGHALIAQTLATALQPKLSP